jgi:hypothetical protein
VFGFKKNTNGSAIVTSASKTSRISACNDKTRVSVSFFIPYHDWTAKLLCGSLDGPPIRPTGLAGSLLDPVIKLLFAFKKFSKSFTVFFNMLARLCSNPRRLLLTVGRLWLSREFSIKKNTGTTEKTIPIASLVPPSPSKLFNSFSRVPRFSQA